MWVCADVCVYGWMIPQVLPTDKFVGMPALQLGSVEKQVEGCHCLWHTVLQTGWLQRVPGAGNLVLLCPYYYYKAGARISGPSSCVCGIGTYSKLLEHLNILWLLMLTKPIVTALWAGMLEHCSKEMHRFHWCSHFVYCFMYSMFYKGVKWEVRIWEYYSSYSERLYDQHSMSRSQLVRCSFCATALISAWDWCWSLYSRAVLTGCAFVLAISLHMSKTFIYIYS